MKSSTQQRTELKSKSFYTNLDTYFSSQGKPDLTIANACFSSLLQTAISASFLLFPLATILSYISLQALLYLQAEKLHKNKRFLSFLSPFY